MNTLIDFDFGSNPNAWDIAFYVALTVGFVALVLEVLSRMGDTRTISDVNMGSLGGGWLAYPLTLLAIWDFRFWRPGDLCRHTCRCLHARPRRRHGRELSALPESTADGAPEHFSHG
jgi:hypothetical protein